MASVTIKTSPPRRAPESGLTGRAVLLITLAFFGVVIGANAALIHYAASTFGGLESDAPYFEGIAYDRDIKAARAQDALGWTVDATIRRAPGGPVEVTVTQRDASGAPTEGLAGAVRFEHPADRSRDRTAALRSGAPGTFVGSIDVPPGQWDLVVDVRRDGDGMFRSRSRIEVR